MTIYIDNIEGIDDAARSFAERVGLMPATDREGVGLVPATDMVGAGGSPRVVAFRAGMGAGKTTFISALCRVLGVESDEISSPTFAIINVYERVPSGEEIYHFDCYRLEDLGEALDMGAEDYLYSGSLCLIEWPDVIEGILPDDTLYVDITQSPIAGAPERRQLSWNFPA